MSRNSGKSCSFVLKKLAKKCFFDSFFGFNRIFQGAMNEKIIAHQKKVAQIEQKNRHSLLNLSRYKKLHLAPIIQIRKVSHM